jgi:PKD repeat protein
MPFPDSTKKAPNVFFETFDDTGAPVSKSFVPAPGPKIVSPSPPAPPPPPPEIFNARWFDPPNQNLTPVTLSNPADVTVFFPPIADFSYDPISGFAPLSVNFTDLSLNNPTSWAWDFQNNGSTDSVAQNPTFIYSVPDTYSAKLTVTNAYGLDEIIKEVNVSAPPPPDPPQLFSALAPLVGLPPTDGLNEMYSATGLTWNTGTTPAPVEGVWADMAYSESLVLTVAVSAGNNSGAAPQLVVSTDGINFIAYPLPAGAQNIFWQSVCWSPELEIFCACSSGSGNSGGGSTDRIMTSSDGINWTVQTTPAFDRAWKSITWSASLSLFVAVADTGGSTDRVMTSPNGINWTMGDMGITRDWQGVAWGPSIGKFCAVSFSNGTIVTSTDGVNWTQTATLGADFYLDVVWVDYLGIFCANNFFGQPFGIRTSPDGIVWTARNTGNEAWVSLADNGNVIVGVSNAGTNRVIRSTDGVTWTPLATQASNRAWSTICWSGVPEGV